MAKIKSQFAGIRQMQQRLGVEGGDVQQDRMIHDKRWTLDHATKYSYQAAQVKHLDRTHSAPALMNPNKLKPDYDDKVLSVGFEYQFQPGDVFEWCNTGTKWLIYLQDLTELAYFKGDVRKCSYEVQWLDDNGELQHTYLAVRGPVETKIDYMQKNGKSVDNPNYSINFMMPKNEATLQYFKRYARFYLQNTAPGSPYVCWRVEAVDNISMQGVIQINAIEYYANKTEDDIENGIVNGKKNEADAKELEEINKQDNTPLMKGTLLKASVEEPSKGDIVGETIIRPNIAYTYMYTGGDVNEWTVKSNGLVKYKITGKRIQVKWTQTYGGKFEIAYGNKRKTIIVKSLF